MTTEELKFKNKYNSIKKELETSQKELNNLLKYGGGQYLEEQETKEEIEKKIWDVGTFACFRTYEENLRAKLELVNLKKDKITNKKSLSELVEESINKQNNSTEANNEISERKTEYFVQQVSKYNDIYKNAYESSSSYVEATQKTISIHQNTQKELTDEIDKLTKESDKTDSKILKDSYKTAISQIKDKQNADNLSYKNFLQTIQAANEIKEKTESKILKACKEAAKEEASDKLRMAQLSLLKAQDKINKQIAKIPQDVIDQFNKINVLLHTLINGFAIDLPGTPNLNPASVDDLIIKITKFLNPVTGIFKGLPLPEVPFLSPILDVMSMVAQVDTPDPNMTELQKKKLEELKKTVEVPSAWKQSLDIFLNTINTVMMLLPTLLIQLIFNMLDVIVGLFNQIAGVIGVPGIPFPLNLIPDCISLMPKLTELMKILPSAMKKMIEDKMKYLAAKMMVCGEGIGDAFSKIANLFTSQPQIQCPEAIKQKFKNQIEAKQVEKEIELLEQLKEKENTSNIDTIKYQLKSFGNVDKNITSATTLEHVENKKLIQELESEAQSNRPNFQEITTTNSNNSNTKIDT